MLYTAPPSPSKPRAELEVKEQPEPIRAEPHLEERVRAPPLPVTELLRKVLPMMATLKGGDPNLLLLLLPCCPEKEEVLPARLMRKVEAPRLPEKVE